MDTSYETDSSLPLDILRRVDAVSRRFDAAWRAGTPPWLEDFLGDTTGLEGEELLRQLLRVELEYRLLQGISPAAEDYLPRFPSHETLVREVMEAQAARGAKTDNLEAVEGRVARPLESSQPLPTRIGRYRVVKLLGEGGFGRVFLAWDENLSRPVAIKVPHPRLIVRPEDVEAYLIEARILASLDHPDIVPVHDVGHTDDGLCFVVSKLIDGSDLARTLKETRFSFEESAELVAVVAEALHHAHSSGLVHRDVKPANILTDRDGKPYLADFGLALREENLGKAAGLAGTPAYMSPEQARGEGHRVDGRSDVFSLGVVFYEMLTGGRPFRADTVAELLEQVTGLDPRPPRQVCEDVPRELERICLKALSKRATERYLTAQDLADDLRHFLAHAPEQVRSALRAGNPSEFTAPLRPQAGPALTPSSHPRPFRIVPKGLRSFDAHDADFFLELVPGPRDRDGLPDSVRFWKRHIEETDTDSEFAVGLIYGPSGCGKSSLVKAGLLPRLSRKVIAVYVEATAEETETRLLNGLRKRCAALPDGLDLKDTLTALRKGQGVPAGRKLLLVLDQFEQWLHAHREEENTELVQALRQCDGGRVQCIVMVRDDYWMAATRFMRELEVRLLEGQNSAAIELFPLRHAKKVLAAFGRAFGSLPESGETGKDQKQFIEQAVSGLAQDGKVVCVRLALFAEMIKGKAWTPATLKEMGGAQGVGVTFLEETFSASTAPPEHRYHQKAARAVLKALLPEPGTDIKGHLRSHAGLLAGSGHASRPKDFDDLIRILDSELRLITPTDPEGEDSAAVQAGEKYYQLTHDYLVPSLRDWLTRKQKETRRGRAELLLADRSAVWNARPENRQLPSLLQWLQVCCLTRKKYWTPPQRKMMRRAARYHLVRSAMVVALMAVLALVGWEASGRLQGQRLRDRLLESTTEDVLPIVHDMAPYRRWLDDSLRQAYRAAESSGDARKRLHASLALLPVDDSQVEYLHGRLLTGTPQEVLVIREALRPHAGALGDRLWSVVAERRSDPGQRLRAACALAVFAPEDSRWNRVGDNVAEGLLAESAFVIGRWADALRPVAKCLLSPLAAALLKEQPGATDRVTLASLYRGYAEDLPDAIALLEKTLAEKAPPDAKGEGREALARRQANAAAALAAMGRWERVLPLLRQVPDPTVRGYVIDRLVPGGVEVPALLARLEEATEASLKQGLLLALGEVRPERLPESRRESLLFRLIALYRDDPDAGIHSAAGWLLGQWGQQNKVREIDQARRGHQSPVGRRWYVNSQGQTMVIVPQPKDWFWMGVGHERPLERHRRRISRSFVIAAREVTVAEFLRFREKQDYDKQEALTPDCPVNGMTWYDAAAYCNWLSKQEGIPEGQWCYLEGSQGIRPAPAFLDRTGYRLPTEAEWEYACRAGSETLWSHGDGVDLLPKYAWCNRRDWRTSPGGVLRPNSLGLFDMHGNVWEWCQDWYRFYEKAEGEKAIEDREQIEEITDKDTGRVLRGGSFDNFAESVRSANRNGMAPVYRWNNTGFRPARTYR